MRLLFILCDMFYPLFLCFAVYLQLSLITRYNIDPLVWSIFMGFLMFFFTQCFLIGGVRWALGIIEQAKKEGWIDK